jgi:hypothetical protein
MEELREAGIQKANMKPVKPFLAVKPQVEMYETCLYPHFFYNKSISYTTRFLDT